MIAGSPALERSLRRRIRSELRASKLLWREYKVHKKARPRSYRAGWLIRLLAPGIALSLMAPEGRHGFDTLVLIALSLYATGSALLRSVGLLRGLWASHDLEVLSNLPLPDSEFFALQWRKFVRSSGWILLTFAGVYALLAVIRFKAIGPAAIGAGLGVLQWILVLGTAAGLAAWRPRWPLQSWGMALCAAAGAILVFHSFTRPWLSETSGKIFLGLPAGWVSLAYRDGVLNPTGSGLLWATPALLAGIVFVAARRRLLGQYRVTEMLTQRPAAEVILEVRARQEAVLERTASAQPALTPGQVATAREEFIRSVPAENEDRIRNGAFLPVYDWSREGILERLYMRMLTRRERVVAELMLGPRLRLSRKWKIAAGLALAGSVLALIAPNLPQQAMAVMAGIFAMTAIHGSWPGFQLASCAGKFMPIYAVQPVGYREISRLFFKMTLLRLVVWTPLAVALGAALGHRVPQLGTTAGLLIALKAAWVLLSIQPVAMVARFSSGSNDTERLTFRGCFGLIVPFMILGIPGLAATICTFALPAPWWVLGAAGTTLSAWALWTFYGAVYNRGRIDLVRSTSTSSA